MKSFGLLLLLLLGFSLACDIIVHLKSETDTKFEGQITASNGNKSQRITFEKKKQRLTFHQKPEECGLHNWSIQTWKDGKEVANVKVVLDGIGRVSYAVDDTLKPVQNDRHGAICKGECAPLAQRG